MDYMFIVLIHHNHEILSLKKLNTYLQLGLFKLSRLFMQIQFLFPSRT